MTVDNETVQQIAHLAMLQIEDGAVAEYASELSSVLALAEQMSDVDTAKVEPMAHPTHAVQRLRADSVTETDRRTELQSVAPSVEGGLYLVPQVLE